MRIPAALSAAVAACAAMTVLPSAAAAITARSPAPAWSDLAKPTAKNVTLREGTLVRANGENAVYIVDEHDGTLRKRSMVSRATFEGLGYSWADIIVVPASQLPAANGPKVALNAAHPDGTAVRYAPTGARYLVQDGKLRRFPSALAFASHQYPNAVKANDHDMRLPKGADIGVREGTIAVTPKGDKYAIVNHGDTYEKRPMALNALNGLGYTMRIGKQHGLFHAVDEADLPARTGKAITDATAHPLGAFISFGVDSEYFLVTDRGLAKLRSAAVIKSHGYDPAKALPGTPAPDMQWITSEQHRRTVGTINAAGGASASGAFGINARWEAGEVAEWRVSQQEAGAVAIAAGISRGDTAMIDRGLLMFDWAFARQQADGSFEPRYDVTASQVIGANFFLAAVARSVMLLEQSPYAWRYEAKIKQYRPLMRRTADWITAHNQWNKWREHIEGRRNSDNGIVYGHYLHQHYEGAFALALTSRVLDTEQYMAHADQLLEYALARGYSLETGMVNGETWVSQRPDTGYGSLGVTALQRTVQYFPKHPLRGKILRVVKQGVAWEASKVTASGFIDSTGNVRSCVAREGHKDPGYSTFADNLGAYSVWLNDPAYAEVASRTWTFVRANPSIQARCGL